MTGNTNGGTPTPRVRVNSLRTIHDCEKELARLYRETRRGDLDPTFAKSLVYILSVLVGVKRDSTLEDFDQRLSQLEAIRYDARHTSRTARPHRVA